jgi:glycosyltransferase involved in cell wall biosynthesis
MVSLLDHATTRTRRPCAPLRVGVLVDLALTPAAGGHVKCWERLAQAALGFADRLDLTVHFMGHPRRNEILGDTVRYVVEPPVLATALLPFLSHLPDHADLSPWHPRLARALKSYEVIHTTDVYFAYARTATIVARRRAIPLVTSIHTNTPQYARIFAAQTIERLCGGPGALSRLLLDRAGLARRIEARMARQLRAHERRCACVLVSRPGELAAARATTDGHAGLLRRGIDRAFFNPEKRDRAWLRATFGVPEDRTVVLFAGRVNRGKNVGLLAAAVEQLVAAGLPLHLICAGEGEERGQIAARLAGHASCPGNVASATLAQLYASTDIFAFPSPVEEYANVVSEALASGLPVLVAAEGGMGRVVEDGVTGFTLPGDRPDDWQQTIAMLTRDPARRAAMAAAARRFAERRLPTWADVLAEDLLPRWEAAAGRS